MRPFEHHTLSTLGLLGAAWLASAVGCGDDSTSGPGGGGATTSDAGGTGGVAGVGGSGGTTASGGAGGNGGSATTSGPGGGGGSAPWCGKLDLPPTDLQAATELVASGGALDVALEVKAPPMGTAVTLSNCTQGGVFKAASCKYAPEMAYYGNHGASIDPATQKGGLPGPTLVLEAGDAFSIHLTNSLAPGGNVAPAETCACNGGSFTDPPIAENPNPTVVCEANACAAGEPHMMDANATNLHVHGLHVNPGFVADAGAQETEDNIFVSLMPVGANNEKATHDYKYASFASTHPSGLFWYHPHNHETSAPQVTKGLAGAIVVKGKIDALLEAEVPCMNDRVMVMQPVRPDPDANATSYDPIWAVNGVDMPTLTIRHGEVQRWRVLNASSANVLYLALAKDLDGGDPMGSKSLGTCSLTAGKADPALALQGDCDLVDPTDPENPKDNAVPWDVMNVIGVDGTPLSRPVSFGLPMTTLLANTADQSANEIDGTCPQLEANYQPGYFMPSGKRLEFLVKFGAATPPGTYWLVTRGSVTANTTTKTLNPQQGNYGRKLAKIVVTADEIIDMPIPTKLLDPSVFGLHPDLRTEVGNKPANVITFSKDFVNGAGGGATTQVINHMPFCPQIPMACAEAGTIDNWDMNNGSSSTHPIHLHVNPMQITSVGATTVSDASCLPTIYEDTITVPPGSDDLGASEHILSLRTKYDPNLKGDAVFHCHILTHEDNAMMGRFTIK